MHSSSSKSRAAMKTTLVFCFAVGFAAVAMGAHLPNGVTPCKSSEEQYKECVLKQATATLNKLANGDKSLGVPKLEPLRISTLDIDSNGFQHKYSNVKLHKLSTGQMTDAKIDIDGPKCELHFEAYLDEIVKEGDYTATGKLLLFTLNGKGKYKLTLKKLKVKFDAECEKVTRDGADYLTVTDLKMVLDPAKVVYEYENLIGGNAELSAEVLKVINENDLDVFKEVKAAYERGLAEVFKVLVNAIFSSVPADELFPK